MNTEIFDTQALLSHIEQGSRPKYLFFWSHQPVKLGQIDKSCFSQWFEAPFKVDDTLYPTAEHYMMAEKARLFQDEETEKLILTASHPGAAKNLGRQVVGFNEQVWETHRFNIVVKGNTLKFSQNEALKTYLQNTRNRILVEASPRDKVWGIGLDKNDPRATDPERWLGLNLLGFALMKVRSSL